MEDLKRQNIDPRQLSPVVLAFVGDGVFELLVREKLVSQGGRPANLLHKMTVERVNAAAQAEALLRLEDALTAEEQDILRRGRNANTSKVPKSASPAQYRRATAVEALFGYLYLKGETARINTLFALMENDL